MSIADDIAREIIAQKRAIAGIRSLPPLGEITADMIDAAIDNPPLLFRDMKLIERMLRIEMTLDLYCEEEGQQALPPRTIREFGPLAYMGVDAYLVHALPAPGWRVINPFSPQ